jgi:Uncharacterized conserved protein (DUF2190)
MPAATHNDGFAKGYNASSAISKGRAVIYDTAAADGETVKQAASATAAPIIGVSKFSVSTTEIAHGKGCSVIIDGRAIVEASAALTQGTVVSVDSSGRAAAASSGNYVLGIVDEPAAAAGDYCSVLLGCDGTKAS